MKRNHHLSREQKITLLVDVIDAWTPEQIFSYAKALRQKICSRLTDEQLEWEVTMLQERIANKHGWH